MAEKSIHTPAPDDDVVKDSNIRSVKKSMMSRLRWNSLLNSISETARFVAGPLFAIGVSSALITGVGALSIALLATAASLLVIGVGAGYASSRIWQGNQFDNFELNAQSTAQHLVEKLKENNLCLTKEHPENCRKDGKAWVIVTQKPAPTQEQTRT